jgi:diketogulonate reductase-like aldo/keto reductase
VDKLRSIAAAKGITLPQLALAWLHGKGKDVFPIPGSRDPARIAENVAAASIVLTEAEVAAVEAATSAGAVGDRYGHGMMGTFNMREKLQAKAAAEEAKAAEGGAEGK